LNFENSAQKISAPS